MAKKRKTEGKLEGASVKRTTTGRVYRQRRPDQHKRRQKNKRIEFVLNPDYPEDARMIALLDSLKGEKSDYIREAIALKMDFDKNPLRDLIEDGFNAVLDHLDRLRQQPPRVDMLPAPALRSYTALDNDDVELTIRADANENSAVNFLTSMMNLQH